MSMELRHPGGIVSGQCAQAPVSWPAWSGPAVSDRISVRLADFEVEIDVIGPAQPSAKRGPQNLSSGWFEEEV